MPTTALEQSSCAIPTLEVLIYKIYLAIVWLKSGHLIL